MPTLDNRTLLVVTALIAIGSALALISLWRAQSKPNGAGFWAAGMTCVALASILISGRGNIPDFVSLVIANTLYVLGFQLLYRGIRVFTNQRPLLIFDFSLLPITASLFFYFKYVDDNVNIRIVVLSAAFVVICSAVVITMLREQKAPWRFAGYAVATVFALFGSAHCTRGFVALITPSEQSFLNPSVTSSLVFLGGVFMIGGIAITLILLTHAVLESELRMFSLAVEKSASSIIITDRDGSIDYVNPASTQNSGYTSAELIGKNPRILQSGEMPKQEYASLWGSISAGKTWRGEFHNRRKNGELFWEIASIAPVKNRSGEISHFVAIKEDISDLKDAKARIQHLAYHDMLTGLPTRQLAMEHLSKALAAARRDTSKVAVLFVDLDGFKSINDNFGHDAGDQVLKQTAERLSSCIREGDTVARFGGDEFLVVLPNVITDDTVTNVAHRMIQTLATPYKDGMNSLNTSASIGIALFPEHSENPQELIKLADQAMYKIKRQSKNNYVIYKAESELD
ncbi:sensor domain-containing diguanylate cyclase [Alginatibacterium sediminis]|uniref:Sensor domain-containing diguanylate cyclase n=1 Tax=Alginatibacterium sediminis TaxID=2164068 RepID=A0A420EBK6_9ALTE|nr:GGDEF domain-containing protein [Alginatibacterium sediminis]RKF18080.1 sensor domain-containing diguanylate cyclase [Alginatibacterium sediminis]